MFFNKSRPFGAVFALTAAAMIFGATSAYAERLKAQDDYCGEEDNCTTQYAGIVQKERDGVNYFYGSSDKTFVFSYQVLRLDIEHEPNADPDEIIQPREFIQYVPYGHSFRPWHHKLKPGHKAGKLGFKPDFFGKSQFRHRNKVYHP